MGSAYSLARALRVSLAVVVSLAAVAFADPSLIRFSGDVRLAGHSLLEIELGGTTPGSGHDKLEVAGELVLEGGVLEVVWSDRFDATAGDVFDILDWGTLTGRFGTVTLPPLPPGLVWETGRLYTDGVLSVRADGWPAWAVRCGLGVGSQLLDADGDGLSNLIEYLLDSDPLSAVGLEGFTAAADVGAPKGDSLGLIFERPATPGADAVYTVQTRAVDPGGKPGDWTTVATKTGAGAWSGSAAVDETELPGGRVRVVVTVSLGATDEPQFIRLGGSLDP